MQNQTDQVCDETIYQQLFYEYAPRIRNFLYYKSGDLQLSEDLTQEAYLRLWKHCNTVSYSKARSFLFTVANNLFLDVVKHKKVVQQFQLGQKPKEQIHGPDTLLEGAEMKSLLEKALMDLPEKQRLVFLLNRIEKMTYKEIAELLDLSVKAVEKRMHKALVGLRAIVAEKK